MTTGMILPRCYNYHYDRQEPEHRAEGWIIDPNGTMTAHCRKHGLAMMAQFAEHVPEAAWRWEDAETREETV